MSVSPGIKLSQYAISAQQTSGGISYLRRQPGYAVKHVHRQKCEPVRRYRLTLIILALAPNSVHWQRQRNPIMSDSLVIPCPHCNGLNRIPHERLGDTPKCGRCKQPVLLSKPFELNQGDYSSQIKGDLPLLVDVWAAWCGPCKAFAPVFEQAAGQLAGKCRLAKLDSEANQQLSAQLGIRSIPSLILFKNGREVARQSGAFPLPQLMSWLRSQGV